MRLITPPFIGPPLGAPPEPSSGGIYLGTTVIASMSLLSPVTKVYKGTTQVFPVQAAQAAAVQASFPGKSVRRRIK